MHGRIELAEAIEEKARGWMSAERLRETEVDGERMCADGRGSRRMATLIMNEAAERGGPRRRADGVACGVKLSRSDGRECGQRCHKWSERTSAFRQLGVRAAAQHASRASAISSARGEQRRAAPMWRERALVLRRSRAKAGSSTSDLARRYRAGFTRVPQRSGTKFLRRVPFVAV